MRVRLSGLDRPFDSQQNPAQQLRERPLLRGRQRREQPPVLLEVVGPGLVDELVAGWGQSDEAGAAVVRMRRPPDERPMQPVRPAAFRIDRFEVTNARFARFLNTLGVRPVSDAEAGAVGADAFQARDADLFIEGADGEEQRPIVALTTSTPASDSATAASSSRRPGPAIR